MKKKVFSLVLCLLMCMSILTGCNLFGRDLATYYNAVVATINYSYTLNGETINERENITKRELITAYKSYGQDYVNNYNYTQAQAIETTLDTIINRKLMIKDVEVQAKRSNQKLFNDRETSYLWQSTYDAFYTNLITYYNEVLGIEDEEDSTTNEEDTGVYVEYKPNATYYTYTNSQGQLQFGVKKTTSVATISGEYEVMYLDRVPYDYEYQDLEGNFIFKERIYDIIQSYTSNTQWQSALNRYISTVRDNYSYMDLGTDSDVFYFELDSIYDIVRANSVIDKYEELYNRAAENGSTLTGVRVNNILDYYENEVLSDYFTYRNNLSTFETDVLSTSTNVHYVPTSSTTKYFYVGVIELNFKNGQKTPEDLENDRLNGKFDPSNGTYDEQLDAIYNAVYADIKNSTTGQSTGDTISAQNLRSEISKIKENYEYLDFDTIIQDEEEVLKILKDCGYESREGLTDREVNQIVLDYVNEENKTTSYYIADDFIKYYYYYNDDTTFQNSDKTSVFGISTDGVVYNETFSDAQNDDFDEALRKLYNNGEGQVGDTSDIIRTDSGVYILFYAGEVNSLFQGVSENFSLNDPDIEKLGSERVNIFNNKTYFDLVYDTIYEDNNFDNFETENLNYLKNTLTKGDENSIIKYYDDYKDLF